MTSDLNSFIELLKQDLNTLSELESILKQERLHLEANDTSAINDIAVQKTPLLATIESHAVARGNWVKSCKVPLPKLLKLLAEKAPAASKLYQQCHQKLKQVHILNEVNGRIIAASQQRVDNLMSIIRGQGKRSQLYGQNGKKGAMGGNLYLTEA